MDTDLLRRETGRIDVRDDRESTAEDIMPEEKIAILVDSCTDVPKEYRDKYKMYVVPLMIIYKDAEYRDGVDIQPEEVFARFCGGGPLDLAAQAPRPSKMSSSRSRPTATTR